MTSTALHLKIEGRLDSTRLLAGAVHGACEALDLPPGAAQEVELAVQEAVVNVIEHAYAGRDGDVIVSLDVDEAWVQVCITDRGTPLPERLRARPPAPEEPTDTAALEEGGRGRWMIHALMDEVTYRSAGGENVLTLRRRRDRVAGGDGGDSGAGDGQ